MNFWIKKSGISILVILTNVGANFGQLFGNQGGGSSPQSSNPFSSQNPFNFFNTPWNQFGSNSPQNERNQINPQGHSQQPSLHPQNNPSSTNPQSPSGQPSNPYSNWPYPSNPWNNMFNNNNNNNNNNNMNSPGGFNPWSGYQSPNSVQPEQPGSPSTMQGNNFPFHNLFYPNQYNQRPLPPGHTPNNNDPNQPYRPPYVSPTTTPNTVIPASDNKHHPEMIRPSPVGPNPRPEQYPSETYHPGQSPSNPTFPNGPTQKVVEEAGPVQPGPSLWVQDDKKPGKVVEEAGPVQPGPSLWVQDDKKPVVEEAGPVQPGPSLWVQDVKKPGKVVEEAGPVQPGPSLWVQDDDKEKDAEVEEGDPESLDVRNNAKDPKDSNGEYTEDFLIFNR